MTFENIWELLKDQIKLAVLEGIESDGDLTEVSEEDGPIVFEWSRDDETIPIQFPVGTLAGKDGTEIVYEEIPIVVHCNLTIQIPEAKEESEEEIEEEIEEETEE